MYEPEVTFATALHLQRVSLAACFKTNSANSFLFGNLMILFLGRRLGVGTVGEPFEAGVTGKEVHLFQLEKLGLSGPIFESGRRRELLSPSDPPAIFLLKLNPRKNPPPVGLPFETPGD
nr:hypothetical protein Itr_chr13CG03470 [Ipomoea trifida]